MFQLIFSSECECLQVNFMYAKDATEASIPAVVTNIAFAIGASVEVAVVASALVSSTHFLQGAVPGVVNSSHLAR